MSYDPRDQDPHPDNVRWFTEEVQPHGGPLKAYLHSSFPSVRDVDDVVQESYLHIWKAKTTQPIRSAKAYLFTVARHLALNLVRRERRSPLSFVGDLITSGALEDRPSVPEVLTEREKIDLLTDALAALPAKTRVLLLLNKFEGLTQSEIAQRQGLTEKAVEHQIARGIRLCTDFLKSKGHDVF
jgi:RNA polymerase sigma-70 factor (ECF subfamily)